MAIDVETEVEIARPRGEVATFAADPDRAPAWHANIERVEWETPPPLAVGSRIAFTARFRGCRMSYVYEVKEYVPGQRLVQATTDGPLAMETTYTWTETLPNVTTMKLRNRGDAPGFSAFAAPLVSRAVSRANRKNLLALKKLLED